MREGPGVLLAIAYEIAALATTVKLVAFDHYVYTWWNWIIALPVDGLLGQMWPIYWGIIRPIFGH